MRDLLDVAHAAIIEPFVHGSWSTLDEIIDKVDEALEAVIPDRDSWGAGTSAQSGLQRAEHLFGQARKVSGKKRRRRKGDVARAVGDGNPLAAGLVSMMLTAIATAHTPPEAPTMPNE